MKQLAGNENRPRQLGDTGIIVLTKCDMGSCDCNQVQKPNSKSKTKVTPQKPRNFASSSTAGQTPKQRRLPTFNRNRSPDRHGGEIFTKNKYSYRSHMTGIDDQSEKKIRGQM